MSIEFLKKYLLVGSSAGLIFLWVPAIFLYFNVSPELVAENPWSLTMFFCLFVIPTAPVLLGVLFFKGMDVTYGGDSLWFLGVYPFAISFIALVISLRTPDMAIEFTIYGFLFSFTIPALFLLAAIYIHRKMVWRYVKSRIILG